MTDVSVNYNEPEIIGNVRNFSPTLWTLLQLAVLYLNLLSDIICLSNLVILDLLNNKLQNLPSEIDNDMITLHKLNLINNSIQNLPYEIGKLFRL